VSRPSPLQSEIRQNRPFASLEQEGVLGLLRTADLVRRRLAGVVEPRGLTLQQYNVLRILRGSRGEGLPTLDIASRMIEQTPGITRLLDRLEAKRLVRRQRCPHDRRRVLRFITKEGLGQLRALDPVVTSLDKNALGGLKRADTAKLVNILDAVRAGHLRAQSSKSNPNEKKKKEKHA
jgi:DNA-binding MarR family transcriptional regulator